LESLILPVGDLVLKTHFMKHLREYRRINLLSKDDLESLQKRKLNLMLEHISSAIPFYSKLGIDLTANPFQELKKLPLLGKKDFRAAQKEFIDPSAKNLVQYLSSGSSGIQGEVLITRDEEALIRAILINWWEWAGYRMGDRILQTGMTPNRRIIKRIKDILFRTRYFVAFGLKNEDVLKSLKSLSKRGKIYFGGYASSLYIFSLVAGKFNLSEIRFQSVISWGDKMFPHYRKSIEKVFKTQVFDTYACNEGLMIAAQKDLDEYYIMSPHIYLEILDDHGNEVPDGQMGNVFVTSLDHFAMPLIRYKNGDLAVKLPKSQYPAKRVFNYPILKKIVGRDTDIVKSKGGDVLIVHFFTGIFEFYPQIKQFQVIQDSLEYLTILYIPDEDFRDDILVSIEDSINAKLESPFQIKFQEVQHIRPTPSGKPQIILNNLLANNA
jgi:phenylacetate-coenzyme A ligase PaaK-like adenylate-forming protein